MRVRRMPFLCPAASQRIVNRQVDMVGGVYFLSNSWAASASKELAIRRPEAAILIFIRAIDRNYDAAWLFPIFRRNTMRLPHLTDAKNDRKAKRQGACPAVST